MITRLSESTARVFQRRECWTASDVIGLSFLEEVPPGLEGGLAPFGPGGQACEDPREERPREEVDCGHRFDVTPDVAPFLAAFDQSQRDGPARMQHVAPEGVDQLEDVVRARR